MTRLAPQQRLEQQLRRAEAHLTRLSNARERGGRHVSIDRVLRAQAKVDEARAALTRLVADARTAGPFRDGES